MYKPKNSNMVRIRTLFDLIKMDIINHRLEYKNFLLVMLIFNCLIIGIAELTIIHPLNIFKKSKYEHKKTDRRIEKSDH